eukprot:6207288-Pleurochrysis_carterae.AAC.5
MACLWEHNASSLVPTFVLTSNRDWFQLAQGRLLDISRSADAHPITCLAVDSLLILPAVPGWPESSAEYICLRQERLHLKMELYALYIVAQWPMPCPCDLDAPLSVVLVTSELLP